MFYVLFAILLICLAIQIIEFIIPIIAVLVALILVCAIHEIISSVTLKYGRFYPPFLHRITLSTPALPINVRQMQNSWKEYIEKVPQAKLPEIDQYTGAQFEEYIAGLFSSLGYQNVLQTNVSGDFGVDVLAEKDGVRYGIQCKRYANSVGVGAIQEINTGLNHWNCQRGIVVTNSRFTRSARTLAAENGIQLVDRECLAALMRQQMDLVLSIEQQIMLYQRWKGDRDRKSFRRKVRVVQNQGTEMDWSEVTMGMTSALLPPGRYVIGEDIPAGKYDIRAYYGNGTVTLFSADENTIKANVTMGVLNEKLYYAREYKNLVCRTGDILFVELIKVEICKSTPVTFSQFD